MVNNIIPESERDSDPSTVTQTKSQKWVGGASCPECDGQVVEDGSQGEITCQNCGLVLDENALDRGPEWRAFDKQERDEKSRVGAPTTELRHDKGLSTKIGWQNSDAYGESLSSRKQTRIKRLRTWDERFRAKDAQERNLKQALGEIERMASALDISEPVRETAGVLYRKAIEEELLPGRSIEGMATAALYASARQHGTPRRLAEFETVSRVSKIRIQRAYRYLSRELGLEIEPEDPTQYIPRFVSSLEVDDETERLARDLLRVAKDNNRHSGKSPAGMAAAAIYAAAKLTNQQLTQEDVSNTSGVSQVTVRDRYQEMLDVYAEHG
jgi:transcription initiation factor TFIIB